MAKVFVFRVATDIPFILSELNEGRLRQGWGNSFANLNTAM